MKLIRLVGILMGIFVLNGCGEASNNQVNNPLAMHAQTLEKAKGVERQVFKADEKRRNLIKNMSE